MKWSSGVSWHGCDCDWPFFLNSVIIMYPVSMLHKRLIPCIKLQESMVTIQGIHEDTITKINHQKLKFMSLKNLYVRIQHYIGCSLIGPCQGGHSPAISNLVTTSQVILYHCIEHRCSEICSIKYKQSFKHGL